MAGNRLVAGLLAGDPKDVVDTSSGGEPASPAGLCHHHFDGVDGHCPDFNLGLRARFQQLPPFRHLEQFRIEAQDPVYSQDVRVPARSEAAIWARLRIGTRRPWW